MAGIRNSKCYKLAKLIYQKYLKHFKIFRALRSYMSALLVYYRAYKKHKISKVFDLVWNAENLGARYVQLSASINQSACVLDHAVVVGRSRFVFSDNKLAFNIAHTSKSLEDIYKKYYFQEEEFKTFTYNLDENTVSIKNIHKFDELNSTGYWVSMLNAASSNWMHFISECAPTLSAMIDNLKDVSFGILIDASLPIPIKDFIKILANGRFVQEVLPGCRVRVEHLIVPLENNSIFNAVWTRPGNSGVGCYVMDEKALLSLRAKILKYFNITPHAYRAIFINRQSRFRFITNIKEVTYAMDDAGLEILAPEMLSLQEQVMCFSQISVLVAQAGAALANIIFMPEGSTVICMKASNEWAQDDYFQKYAKIFNVNLLYMNGPVDNPKKYDPKRLFSVDHPMNANFSISVKDLLMQLDQFYKAITVHLPVVWTAENLGANYIDSPIDATKKICVLDHAVVQGGSRFVIHDNKIGFNVAKTSFDLNEIYKKYYLQEEAASKKIIYKTDTNTIIIKNFYVAEQLPGYWISTLNVASSNWMHFVAECAPMLYAAIKHAQGLSFGLLVDEGLPSTIKELIKILAGGCPVREVTNLHRIEVEHLIVPLSNASICNAVWTRGGVSGIGRYVFDEQDLILLREKLLGYFNIIPHAHRLVYLNRKSNFRFITNNEEIKYALNDAGLESLTPGLMSLKDQIISFSQIALLVAQAGAALANIMFMPKGSTVICMNALNEWAQDDYFQKYAKIFNINLVYISGPVDDPRKYDPKLLFSIAHPLNASFSVPVRELLAKVNEFHKTAIVDFPVVWTAKNLGANYINSPGDPTKEICILDNAIVEGSSRFVIHNNKIGFNVADTSVDLVRIYKKYYLQEEAANKNLTYKIDANTITIRNFNVCGKLPGYWISTLNVASNNWMHFLSECAPMLYATVQYAQGIPFGILVDVNLPETIKEIIKILVGDHPIQEVKNWRHVEVEHLIVPLESSSICNAVWTRGGQSGAGCYVSDIQDLPFVRAEILKHFNITPVAQEKIYIDRSSRFRFIVNNEEVKKAMVVEGFKCVLPGALSLKEQVECFSKASIVVAQAGAALGNIMFMPEGSTVICLTVDSEWIHYDYFRKYANAFKVNLVYVLGTIDDLSKYDPKKIFSIEHPLNANFSIAVDTLLKELKQVHKIEFSG